MITRPSCDTSSKQTRSTSSSCRWPSPISSPSRAREDQLRAGFARRALPADSQGDSTCSRLGALGLPGRLQAAFAAASGRTDPPSFDRLRDQPRRPHRRQRPRDATRRAPHHSSGPAWPRARDTRPRPGPGSTPGRANLRPGRSNRARIPAMSLPRKARSHEPDRGRHR